MFQDKILKSVAEAVRKVMEADLSAKQKKIAAVAGDPKKIDAKDFKKLRGEEVEQIDEAPMKSGAQSRREVDSVMDKYGFGSKQKEAPKSTTRTVAGKSYGADYKDPEGADDADDKKPEAGPKKSVKKGVFKRRYNTKAYTKESFTGLLNDYMDGGVKSLLESLEIVEVEEEVSNDEFDAEVKLAQAKSEGKGKKAEVAKGKEMSIRKEEFKQIEEDEMTQRKKEQVVTVKHKDSGKELRVVKTAVADYQKRGYHPVKEEVEQMDELSVNKMLKYTDAANKNREVLNTKWDKGTATEREKNKVLGHEMGVDRAASRVKAKTGKNPHEIGKLLRMKYAVTKEEVEQMDERHLTDAETSTKEHNVKSMKKNLSGFKERYGKDAKSVMYATATKQAKED